MSLLSRNRLVAALEGFALLGGFLKKAGVQRGMRLCRLNRCDQLTHYLTKIQGAPPAASTAAGNGPSAEVASIDGYKVGKSTSSSSNAGMSAASFG